ncbi:MAG: uL22 family ribosomal protein [Candidatus Berkelbacteria bacterium]|nr:uL22 family ribosomal protein [Candidatus Berkelbacteria bacterium]
MMQITSGARFVKNAPDKLRILEGLIKNKSIDEGIAQLSFSGRIAGKSLILVLKQAKAQIKDKDLEIDGFKVKSLQINEGPKLKRRRIRQQGRSTAILKRMSHIKIIIDDGKKEKVKEKNGS